MGQRTAVTKVIATQYKRSDKTGKGVILDVLAGLAPWLTGGLGDFQLGGVSADRAALSWEASSPDTVVRGWAAADQAAAPATQASFQVGGVGDQTVSHSGPPCSSREAASRRTPPSILHRHFQ